MADDSVFNPRNLHGVPLYGPMADHVNKAIGDAWAAQRARFAQEGRLRPEVCKAAVALAREDAIAQWRKDHPEDQ